MVKHTIKRWLMKYICWLFKVNIKNCFAMDITVDDITFHCHKVNETGNKYYDKETDSVASEDFKYEWRGFKC